ncbi:MAG TPA: M12 family metallo-peptidase [Steroidobacteraceae bacterium]|nr:M12 family metallo-peptidase [Steroidobacteraceae bacterium]
MPVTLLRLTLSFTLVSLSLFSLLAHAADVQVQVLRYEAIAVDFKSRAASATSPAATATTMRFTAFGKSYLANLEVNTRISPAAMRAQPFLGTIDGRENSWVRITRNGDEVHGLLFDGTDLLAIEPAKEISADAPQGLAIFRLADTKTDLGADFCRASDAPLQSGLDMYKGLGADSKSILAQTQSSGARLRLDMSALMDAAFRSRYASDADANDAIVARVNNVDGIFSSQVGVEVAIAQITEPESSGPPIFTSTSPNTLLQTVSRVRMTGANPNIGGITHLFTGIDMDGTTVGIAYINMVCSQQYGVSLSESRDHGTWFDSLVAAHELGHTFGSPHDGEGQCASTPTTFLMSPIINGSNQFSQCSIDIIKARAQTASCLTPIPVADISLPANFGAYRAGQNQSITLSLTASNTGNVASLNSQLQIAIPAGLTVTAASVAGGNCTITNSTVSCDLGSMAALDMRYVTITLIGTQPGTYSITATTNASTDVDPTNDASTATIRIDPTVDLAVTLTAPDTTTADQTFSATLNVTNKSNTAATDVSVDIVMPNGMTLMGTAQLDGTACQTQFQTIHCSMSSLAANRTIAGALTLAAHDSGTQMITASLSGSYFDPQPQDNFAQKSIAVSAAPSSAAATAQSVETKSGGGALNIYFLFALAFVLVRRRISMN